MLTSIVLATIAIAFVSLGLLFVQVGNFDKADSYLAGVSFAGLTFFIVHFLAGNL